jgi:hypothetical protein
MATYNHLIRYLLEIEHEAEIFLFLKKIAYIFFAIAILLLISVLFNKALTDQFEELKFFSDIEKILGLFGITGSTLASALYAQVRADELNTRRLKILCRMRWLSFKEIPSSFYEELLADSFKDSLK